MVLNQTTWKQSGNVHRRHLSQRVVHLIKLVRNVLHEVIIAASEKKDEASLRVIMYGELLSQLVMTRV